jgi:metal-responsive CopG/Arc/MetJ family transcriptional regulator
MRSRNKSGNFVLDGVGTVRASISFPTDLYKALEEKARQKKVSLAWIVRDAAEKYLDQLTSLGEGGSSR